MPSSTSSRKRPALSTSIQPPITSYFSPASNNSCPSSLSTANTTNNTTIDTKTPNTIAWGTNNVQDSPGDIKSKLLNVGMRVRKAVPEGLKTGTYKSTKFGVTPPSQEKALAPSKVKGNNNKRGYQEDPEIETSMQTERPAGQISMPKSLNKTYHATVPRGLGGDIHMVGQYENDDFEEAGFLRPVE
ncbi:hypothetical protein DFP73DRAFT_144018 [Morchella snyderi]|nr:hypothetical protein DFP73DRAFT_144018 [Morchella snyderi]